MLRVHDVSDAKLFSSALGMSGLLNYPATMSVRMLPMFHNRSNFKIYRFGGIEPDIFGENIRYPHSGLYHKWDSIRHFKVDGDLYPFNVADIDAAFGGLSVSAKFNALTGDSHPLNLYFSVDQTCRWTANMYHDVLRYNVGMPSRERENLFAVPCFMRAIALGNGCYALYSMTPTYLYKYGDHYSFAMYVDKPTQEYGVNSNVNVSFVRYELKDDYVYRYSGTPPADFTSNRRVFSALEGAQLAYHVADWVEELVVLYASRVTWRTSASATYKAKTLRGYQFFRPSCPNFEAVFSEDRRNPNWRALASQAYQSLGMSDINGIAYLSDLIEMGTQVRSFAGTLKSIPSQKVKAAASAWLAVHYGFKLMLLDTKTLIETFEKQSLRTSRLSKCQAATSWDSHGITFTARYQVFYDQFAHLVSELQKLQELTDATITSENIWDMVPFSFVIDWFVSIGDVLQSLDIYANLIQKHEVICSGRSIKGACRAKASQLGLPDFVDVGNVQLSCYFRRYEKSLQPPSLFPSVTVNPFNHMVEGAALWISRK